MYTHVYTYPNVHTHMCIWAHKKQESEQACFLLRTEKEDWKDDSVLKSTDCYLPEKPGSIPSTNIAAPQLSETPAPGNPIPLHKNTCRQSTSAHNIKINKSLKKKQNWVVVATPLIPALERLLRQVDLWVWGQPGLQSEFQDSQDCNTKKPCLEKPTKQQKPEKNARQW